MPINIKDDAKLAEKFARRAGGATADYAEGIETPKRSQSESAIAQKDTWRDAVSAAAADDRFAKGLRKAGDEKWSRKARSVGRDRYSPGVTAAKSDWQAGVAPYLGALRTMTLPAKGLRRSPQNVLRVQAVIDTLGKVKTGGA